jgi:hypothetical protein
MARIAQSIDINVPVHAVYDRLTRFEDYPYFMQKVKALQQLDDTHLHWTTIMSNRPVEWDAEITEQQPDRCIAWRNVSGPTNMGKVELSPVSAEAAHVTVWLESDASQVPGSPTGESEEEMLRQLTEDMGRLKEMFEMHGSATAPGARAASPGYAAGSEGWDGSEEPAAPEREEEPSTPEEMEGGSPTLQQSAPDTQSDASLSQASGEDERFSVAEEVSLDQQSDQARRVGQPPQETGAADPAAAMADSMKQDAQLKQSIKRAVPPSE